MFKLIIDQSRTLYNHLIIKHPAIQNYSYQKYQKNLRIALENSNLPSLDIPQKFVIFNFPRTGSNLLCGMLNSHPEILCHHEIFNPEHIYYSKNFHELYNQGNVSRKDLINGKTGLATIEQRNLAPEKFLISIWQHHYQHKAVGFNLFPNHIPNASTSIIKDKNIKKILLIRRNKLKTYTSYLVAKKTGIWDLYNNKKGQTTKVKINTDLFLKWSQQYELYFKSMRQKLAESSQSYLEVNYEDITGHNQEVVKEKLLKFIGVSLDISYLTPPLKKQNSNKLSDLISNYDELQNALIGTELESLLSLNY